MSAGKHGASFTVTRRDSNGKATEWRAKCGQHVTFTGTTYEAVEDQWRMHVHAETGQVVSPMGDKSARWQP